jgi:hypothetical protein
MLILAQNNTIVLIVYFYKGIVKFFIDFSLKFLLTLYFCGDNIMITSKNVEAEGCLQQNFYQRTASSAERAVKFSNQLPPAECRRIQGEPYQLR